MNKSKTFGISFYSSYLQYSFLNIGVVLTGVGTGDIKNVLNYYLSHNLAALPIKISIQFLQYYLSLGGFFFVDVLGFSTKIICDQKICPLHAFLPFSSCSVSQILFWKDKRELFILLCLLF